MRKSDALKLIDAHKNKVLHPTEMLHWTWLRVIILQIPEDKWEQYLERAVEVMSR